MKSISSIKVVRYTDYNKIFNLFKGFLDSKKHRVNCDKHIDKCYNKDKNIKNIENSVNVFYALVDKDSVLGGIGGYFLGKNKRSFQICLLFIDKSVRGSFYLYRLIEALFKTFPEKCNVFFTLEGTELSIRSRLIEAAGLDKNCGNTFKIEKDVYKYLYNYKHEHNK